LGIASHRLRRRSLSPGITRHSMNLLVSSERLSSASNAERAMFERALRPLEHFAGDVLGHARSRNHHPQFGYTKKRDNSFHNTLQKNRAEKPMVVRNAFCIAFF
jgi:hypothetical protein